MDLSSLPTSFSGRSARPRSSSGGVEQTDAASSKRRRRDSVPAQKFLSDRTFLQQFSALHGTNPLHIPAARSAALEVEQLVLPEPSGTATEEAARLPFRVSKVVAPMVGQCELAFR